MNQLVASPNDSLGSLYDQMVSYGQKIESYLPLGLPPDPVSQLPPPGLETTLAASGSSPYISSLQGVWDSITSASESAAKAVESGITKVYGKVKQGVGTVYDDVTNPVGSLVENAYWKILLGVVVVGVAVYYIGKTGAVKVSV